MRLGSFFGRIDCFSPNSQKTKVRILHCTDFFENVDCSGFSELKYHRKVYDLSDTNQTAV